MKVYKKKVPKTYREMTQREREKLPLVERYRQYFNEYRGAQIEIIGESDDGKGGKQIIIRYLDGREVPLPDVLTWTELFDKFDKMHPKKTITLPDPSPRLSPTRPDRSPGG